MSVFRISYKQCVQEKCSFPILYSYIEMNCELQVCITMKREHIIAYQEILKYIITEKLPLFVQLVYEYDFMYNVLKFYMRLLN